MTLEFDWFNVPGDEFRVGRTTHRVEAFEISFTPVTLGQYELFLQEANYKPIPDKIRGRNGYLLDYAKINSDTDPNGGMYCITHDDAVAFCEWANVRLPTDPELGLFFASAVQSGATFLYAGDCWTSDSDGDNHFIARDGPYQPQQLNEGDTFFRHRLHRHQWEFDPAPCVRVVRT